VSLFTDITDLCDHRKHGSLSVDATPPAWTAYRLTVACPCGSPSSDGSLRWRSSISSQPRMWWRSCANHWFS